MCLIIASPTGKNIPKDILSEASRSNGDGGGVAWLDRENHKIRFKKGLTLAGVEAVVDGPAKGKAHVVHFRIATHGGVCRELTHPFVIDEKASIDLEGAVDSVLFHNGTWGSWKETLIKAIARGGLRTPRAPWSDTRAMALVCHVYGAEILSLLDDAKSSRWLVFDANAAPDDMMSMWGTWHDWEGFKFSGRQTRAFNTTHQSSEDYRDRRSASFPGPSTRDAAADSGTPTSGTAEQRTTSASTSSNIRKYQPKKGAAAVWSKFTKNGLAIAGTAV